MARAERYDATLYVRVPADWKDTVDREAARRGVQRAELGRLVVHAGMVALGLVADDAEAAEPPAEPPAPSGAVLYLRRDRD